MPKGFDATGDVTAVCQAAKVAGYDFVARYLSQSSWKVINAAEATAIGAAGLALVLVYEDASNSAGYFSFGRGDADGLRAAQQAELLGAPAGTVLYFAVDYDASDSDISGAVSQYFNGVASGLKSHAASNGTAFSAGVYGSGATCSYITGAGLAQSGWMAQSRGWSGYDSYSGWSILQGMPTIALGMSVDPDAAVDGYGAIPPPGSP